MRPEISPVKIPDDLSEGKRFSVMCLVISGTPPISFSWTKDGKPVGSLAGVKISHLDDFQDVLQIEKLSVNHVGNYSCVAKNMYGTDHMSVPVTLKIAPQWSLQGAVEGTKITAVTGEAVEISCAASGYPTPVIRIFKGALIVTNARGNGRADFLETVCGYCHCS